MLHRGVNSCSAANFSNFLASLPWRVPALRPRASEAQAAAELYDVPPFGNVSLLHITDTHAQLLPVYFREPSGEEFLEQYKIKSGTPLAHALTHVEFETLARRYGKVGGFAHLATLVKRLRATRPHALLLDGGDSWQGSATALWTRGADMMGAQQRLGVDYMTAHWEFTYGAERVKETKLPLLAQNVRTADFEDPVFEPYALRSVNGVPIAVIGQAFPYTPIANPRHFVPDWTFGIQEALLQRRIDEVRQKGAKAVVLLSHNGMHVDLKLASRVRGLDAILGGHTHDAMPRPARVGKTLVTNAGCNGKFLAVLDLQVGAGGVTDARYRLLPVFSRLLEEDRDMAAYIAEVRRPFETKLKREAGADRGPALPPRQLQRQFRRADPAGVAEGERRRNRLLARLPLGHDLAARRCDHARAPDGPDGDHVSPEHIERAERRADQGDPGGHRGQRVQRRSVPAAGRRHGQGRRHDLRARTGGAHRLHAYRNLTCSRTSPWRQQSVTKWRVGAGRAGYNGGADLGRRDALPARHENRPAARGEPPAAGRR